MAMRPHMAVNVRPYVLSAEAERALGPGQAFRECATATHCPVMIVVPAGSYTMGSPETETGRFPSKGPQQRIAINRPFAVAKFHVTFADWDVCVSVGGCPKSSDSGYGRDMKPVINVNWYEAKQYVEWLSLMTGQPYRLLTEAEWEYAARAGTTTAYSWGDEVGEGNANCDGCGSKWDKRETSPVGSFKPNAFGLYDMHGNVYQWVEDCFEDSLDGMPADGKARTSGNCSRRVIRGGSWDNEARIARSADRYGDTADGRSGNRGFRVARTLKP